MKAGRQVCLALEPISLEGRREVALNLMF